MSKNLQSNDHSVEYVKKLNELLQLNTNPKWGLTRMNALLETLKLKESPFKLVQVLGTNGKGSTVAFIESILREHGFVTGAFISPHLSCARERIRLNGQMISEERFVEAANFAFEGVRTLHD